VGWRHGIDTNLCLAVANPPTQTFAMLAVGWLLYSCIVSMLLDANPPYDLCGD